MANDDVENRCSYVFDPAVWRDEHGTASQLTQNELTDNGVWRCPHSTHADRERCLFHIDPEDKNSDEVRFELLHRIGQRGKKKKQFVGARFGDLNLSYDVLESDDNHLIDLRHAKFEGKTTFKSAIVRQPLRLDGSILRGNARFVDTVFEAEAYFSETTFHDDAYFINATFDQGGYFYNSTLRGDSDFSMAVFHDEVDFIEATFQRVHFREGVFEGRADFKKATFHHGMFWGARFDGNALFNESTFDERANFREAVFARKAQFADLQLFSDSCYIDLRRSSIARGVLSQPSEGKAVYDLKDATVGDLTLPNDATGAKTLDCYRFVNTTFDGFDFGRYRDVLNATDWTIHDVVRSVGVDVGSSDPSPGDLESTYLKAKNGANRIGDVKAAAEFFRKEMTYRRRQHALQARDGTGSIRERTKAAWRWSANALLDVTAGYGERSSRVVAVSVGIVVCFAVLFAILRPTPPYGSQFGYLILSLESFVTLVHGGGATIDDSRVRLLAQLEGFSGAFLIALFVFTLTRSIHR